MIRCGITGSTGSIGSVVIKKIPNFKFIKFSGNVTNKKDVEKWIKKNNFDLIIHLAAIVPIKLVNKNKRKAYNVNYLGTKNIVDSVLKFRRSLNWFFFSSTSHVYKSKTGKITENDILKPLNHYGFSKLNAEKYIKKKLNKKVRYCIGRIFSTTNKNKKKNYFVPDIKKKIFNSRGFLKFKNLNHFRDFISPRDIAKIIFLLWRKKYNGVVNIGSGHGLSLKKIVLILLKQAKKKNFKIYENDHSTSLVADISKLKKIIKWKRSLSINHMLSNN